MSGDLSINADIMVHYMVCAGGVYHFSSGSSICDEVNLVLEDILILLCRRLPVFGPSLDEGSSDLVALPILLFLPGC